jgi:GNAT superfamily N-acetyltransferase
VHVVRVASPDDLTGILAVYSACIAADRDYLPFLAAGDDQAVLGWYRLKPLAACLVAAEGQVVAGVAGLRDTEPGPGAGEAGGRWLEACRLAVHPGYRGTQLTRDLITARITCARKLGADRLWLRCVEGSPAQRLYEANGWTWWASTEFDGQAAYQRAVLLARTLDL